MKSIVCVCLVSFLSISALADQDDSKRPVQVSLSCPNVKEAVKAVGLEAAERMARAAGISEKQIKEAHRCLTSSSR